MVQRLCSLAMYDDTLGFMTCTVLIAFIYPLYYISQSFLAIGVWLQTETGTDQLIRPPSALHPSTALERYRAPRAVPVVRTR